MGMPDEVHVEVAFTTDPAVTPSWTDISAYLKRFTIHRGRADELAAFSAGTAQIVLDNKDRRFDPSYAAGAYSPNVLPMRRVKIWVLYGGITYEVFRGYATNWRQVYAPPQDAECVLEVTDGFKFLANVDLPASVWAQEVAADLPDLWWRLDEPAGSTSVVDSSGNGYTGTKQGPSVSFGAGSLVAYDPGGAAGFASTSPDSLVEGAGPSLTESTVWAIEFWVKFNSFPGITRVFTVRNPTSPRNESNQVKFEVSISGEINFTPSNTGGTGTGALTLGGPFVAGVTYHCVATYDSDKTARFYVDGVLVATAAAAMTGTFDPSFYSIGDFDGTIDEFTVYVGGATTALSTTRIAAHNTAGRTPWVGDLTGARVTRILNAVAWPAGDRIISTGSSTLQAADLGVAALEALQEVEQTEFGALFMTAAGEVRFIGRDSLLKTPYTLSQGTFGDSGAELEYANLEFEYGDDLIINEARVSRSGGAVQVASDAASITKYLKRTASLSGLLHQSDLTSRDAANWLVTNYKDPLLRVTGMKLEPSRGNESTHYPQVLGRDLMDRVTVVRRPQNLGAAISQDCRIQGITHQVSAVDWKTTWNLSPAETLAYWIAGIAGRSEAGVTTRAGF